MSIRLHRHPLSGHCHRVELFAGLAGIPLELVTIDLVAGAQRRPEFLALNPAGQVPVLEEAGETIADANAILVWLARRHAPDWLPADPRQEAEVQKFLSLAAGDIAFGPAAARLVTLFGAPLDPARCAAVAERAFARLEAHLAGRDWLVGGRPTIADVAIYSYTARAPEGNVPLDPWPAIRGWLARVEALPGFVPMVKSPVGLAA